MLHGNILDSSIDKQDYNVERNSNFMTVITLTSRKYEQKFNKKIQIDLNSSLHLTQIKDQTCPNHTTIFDRKFLVKL
jgi:hypothetical protein